MKACVKKHLSLIHDIHTASEIHADINRLQVASTEQLFEAASKLFLKKWRASKNESMRDFLEYFESEWLKVCIKCYLT